MKSSRRDKFKNQTEYKVEYWNLLSVTLQKQINKQHNYYSKYIYSFIQHPLPICLSLFVTL